MKEIIIQTIKHDAQRYPTAGDYKWDKRGVLTVKVSEMHNDDYEFLVALHELIEAHLIHKHGIKEQAITGFDKAFEMEREDGQWTDEEPGDDPRAPYRLEHKFATKIEKIIAKELGINWKEYDKTVTDL